MPRALSTSDGTPPPPMATRVLPPRSVKKRPAAEASSDVEDVPKPKPAPKKTATVKKTPAKKGAAKRKGKAAETEKEKEKKPVRGKGKQKADAADEEPAEPKAKRRKTTKAAPAPKPVATRATKRPSPPDEEEAAPLALTSNAALPGTPPRKRQRLMDEQPVRRSPRHSVPAAGANTTTRALTGNSQAPEPARESPRQRLGQRRVRAPQLAPLVLPAPLGPGILTPSPEPEARETTPRETTPHEATPPASPRESSRPPSLGTLGLSQLHNPILSRAELGRGSPTPDAEARSPSPAPTEIVHHFQPARERPLDEINRELAEAGIKVRDFAWEGVYHEKWKVLAENTRQKRARERARLEAKTEEWDREDEASQPAPRQQIGPPPSQAGPSTQPARMLGRVGTLNRVGSAATFPPQPATQPAETQAPSASSRPPNSQPAPGRRALVRASRPLGRTGTVASFYQTPGAGPSNAATATSNAVAGPSNTARVMTPVREDTPVVEDAATPIATPQTTPTALPAASNTAPSRPTTPSPAATRTRRNESTRRVSGSSDSSRRISGEHSGLPRTPSSLSLVSVL